MADWPSSNSTCYNGGELSQTYGASTSAVSLDASYSVQNNRAMTVRGDTHISKQPPPPPQLFDAMKHDVRVLVLEKRATERDNQMLTFLGRLAVSEIEWKRSEVKCKERDEEFKSYRSVMAREFQTMQDKEHRMQDEINGLKAKLQRLEEAGMQRMEEAELKQARYVKDYTKHNLNKVLKMLKDQGWSKPGESDNAIKRQSISDGSDNCDAADLQGPIETTTRGRDEFKVGLAGGMKELDGEKLHSKNRQPAGNRVSFEEPSAGARYQETSSRVSEIAAASSSPKSSDKISVPSPHFNATTCANSLSARPVMPAPARMPDDTRFDLYKGKVTSATVQDTVDRAANKRQRRSETSCIPLFRYGNRYDADGIRQDKRQRGDHADAPRLDGMLGDPIREFQRMSCLERRSSSPSIIGSALRRRPGDAQEDPPHRRAREVPFEEQERFEPYLAALHTLQQANNNEPVPIEAVTRTAEGLTPGWLERSGMDSTHELVSLLQARCIVESSVDHVTQVKRLKLCNYTALEERRRKSEHNLGKEELSNGSHSSREDNVSVLECADILVRILERHGRVDYSRRSGKMSARYLLLAQAETILSTEERSLIKRSGHQSLREFCDYASDVSNVCLEMLQGNQPVLWLYNITRPFKKIGDSIAYWERKFQLRCRERRDAAAAAAAAAAAPLPIGDANVSTSSIPTPLGIRDAPPRPLREPTSLPPRIAERVKRNPSGASTPKELLRNNNDEETPPSPPRSPIRNVDSPPRDLGSTRIPQDCSERFKLSSVSRASATPPQKRFTREAPLLPAKTSTNAGIIDLSD